MTSRETSKDHWERLYSTRASHEVSWFQEHAEVSLRRIREAGVSASAAILDVGGGASTLVDDLVAGGFENLTVLDLSGAALAAARARLGPRAERVRWIEADVLEVDLPRHSYDVWHDRAVFHFLTREKERRAYVRAILHALKPGGLVVVAAFAEDGPTRCSGLPVVRYGAARLQAELEAPFELLAEERQLHRTPGGQRQPFVYCVFRRIAS